MKLTADMSFDDLLELASNNPDIHEEIERRYGANVAILVVDFSSMRARMDAFGTVAGLVTIQAAFQAYKPAVEASGGRVIKSVADTFFAVFDAPTAALNAALDGHRRMAVFNESRPGDIALGVPNAPIYPRAGLGFGCALVLPEGNLYGPEVNRAFVLGEDVAVNHEVLASEAFAAAVGVPPSGVGVHSAPHDREHDSGFPFHIYTDYRDDTD